MQEDAEKVLKGRNNKGGGAAPRYQHYPNP